MKTCSYCLTVNNPTSTDWLPYMGKDFVQAFPIPNKRYGELIDEEINKRRKEFALRHPLMDKLGIQYIIYGVEYAKTGTKHYQMFVVFRRPRTFNYVKKIWPTAHIEHTRGSFAEARDYCKKAGKFYSFGYDVTTATDNVARDNSYRAEKEFTFVNVEQFEERLKKLEETQTATLALLLRFEKLLQKEKEGG